MNIQYLSTGYVFRIDVAEQSGESAKTVRAALRGLPGLEDVNSSGGIAVRVMSQGRTITEVRDAIAARLSGVGVTA